MLGRLLDPLFVFFHLLVDFFENLLFELWGLSEQLLDVEGEFFELHFLCLLPFELQNQLRLLQILFHLGGKFSEIFHTVNVDRYKIRKESIKSTAPSQLQP